MYYLLILVLLAVYHDIKSYKIKNYIIVIGIITGLAFNIRDLEFTAIYTFLLATILPIIILFPLFLIKVLGAGDIKFFSVIGSYMGVSAVVEIIIISFLIGAIISIIYLICTKSFLKRLNHLKSYISNLIKENKIVLSSGKVTIKDIKISPYYEKDKHGRQGVIHFSVAILFALLIYLI